LSEVTAMFVNLYVTPRNNQLFVVLRKQITNIQKTDTKIQEMTSTIKDIDMKFKENKNFKTEIIGSISEITGPW
jgi:hypothetical protein